MIQTRHSKGILYMLLSSILFALMGYAVKKLSVNMSSVEIVFFRNIFGSLFIIFSFYYIPNTKMSNKYFLLFIRGFIGVVALLMFFYNIVTLSLAKAIVFSQTSPIFTAIFAFLLFRENLSPRAWLGIFIGFIGILFITNLPVHFSKSDYLGILSGVFAGLAYNSVKQLREHFDSRIIVLSFTIIGTIVPVILMYAYYFIDDIFILSTFDFMLAPFVIPSGDDWFYIMLLGIFATSAQILMTKAYGYTKAGVVGAIGYSTIVFSVIVGLFLGEGLPGLLVSIGIVLVMISGLLVAKNKDAS